MERFLSVLLENTLLFSLLFLGVWSIKTAFKKQLSSAMHYFLWGIVILKLMVPFTFASAISPWSLFDATGQTVSVQNPESAAVNGKDEVSQLYEELRGSGALSNQSAPPETPGTAALVPAKPAYATLPTAVTKVTVNVLQIVFDIWLCGIVCMGAWLFISALRIRTKMAGKAGNVPESLCDTLNSCKEKLGIQRHIPLVIQTALPVPAIMGCLRPVLILPPDVLGMDRSELEHVLLHELTHYKRGDLAVTMALNILNAVYWFNPFVWLAFSLIRKDMETACDNAVLTLLGKVNRQAYIGTVVRFAGRNDGARLQAAMSFGKTYMKQRINGMFLRKKTKYSVKIPVLALVLLLAFGSFTSACKATPDSPIVVGKNDLELKIKDNGNANLNIPKTAQLNYTEGKMTVNLNAQVDVPGVSKIPVVKIAPDVFTQERVDRAIKVLMQGKPIYKRSDVATKSQLERELIYMKALKVKYPQAEKKFDTVIPELENRIKTAPETVQREPATGKLEAYNAPDEGGKPGLTGLKEMNAVANFGKDYDAQLYVNSSESGKITNIWFSYLDIGNSYASYASHPDGTARGMSMTKPQAQALAEQTVNDIGAGLSLCATRLADCSSPTVDEANPKQAYVFYFTRAINGFPTTYDKNDGTMVDAPEGDAANYFEPYPYERLYMIIDDTGIVEFQWVSPVKITQTVTDNAAIIQLDKALDIFKTQFSIQHASKALTDPGIVESMRKANIPVIMDENIKSDSFTISRITLGLIRVPVKDKPNEYMLVPVWDFFGTEHVEYNGSVTGTDGKKKTSETFDCSDESFLTINAIDGSIIVRSKGGGVG